MRLSKQFISLCVGPHRCEAEESVTGRLQQQVSLLRATRRREAQSGPRLQAELRHAAAELHELRRGHQVADPSFKHF